MYSKLNEYIQHMDITSIATERIQSLDTLALYIKSKREKGEDIGINFICTHNSRRSHLGQIWAAAMADFYQLENVLTFSGGTEATAVYPMVLETLKEQFFEIEMIDDKDDNPMYSISYDEHNPQFAFSKMYDDSANPDSEFAAVMTCSQADQGCPFIPGAEKRIAITYEDPKSSDNTDRQREVYLERSLQIATEMKYVFSKAI